MGRTVGKVHEQRHELIPRDFLRVLAVWSLIPAYTAFGGFLGFLVDRWQGWFPFATGAGLLIALTMAVRDMVRLREVM